MVQFQHSISIPQHLNGVELAVEFTKIRTIASNAILWPTSSEMMTTYIIHAFIHVLKDDQSHINMTLCTYLRQSLQLQFSTPRTDTYNP